MTRLTISNLISGLALWRAHFNFKVPATPVAIQPWILRQKGYEAGGATLELDYIEEPVPRSLCLLPVPSDLMYIWATVCDLTTEATGNNLSVSR
ncbi:MAG: hypothetical protein U5J63_04840 [Fodinibius sp.]|nr:hypothetical protein [Fodinibius sp.]